MLSRIKALFGDGDGASEEGGARPHATDELQLAAAALLVEAATMDRDYDETERGRILGLIRRRFAVSEDEARELVAAAEARVADSAQYFGFTRTINDRFSHEERIELIEMLWEVVYADGRLHDHEASLLRRIGGLIYVTDRERGEARKRALRRLGLPDDLAGG
jgi:uncharacterized tellurite resistance protein B-like protein